MQAWRVWTAAPSWLIRFEETAETKQPARGAASTQCHPTRARTAQRGPLQPPASHFLLAILCLDDQLLRRVQKINYHQLNYTST